MRKQTKRLDFPEVKSEVFTVRLSINELEEINGLAKFYKTDKSKLTRWLIWQGMRTVETPGSNVDKQAE